MRDRKKQRKRKQASEQARGPFFTRDPFAALSQKDRVEVAVAWGHEARSQSEQLLRELEEAVARVEPFHVLALMARYSLMQFAPRRDEDIEAPKVQQSYVEFLQALFLRLRHHPGRPLASPEEITLFWQKLPTFFEHQQHARLPTEQQLNAEETAEQSALRMVQEYLRAHTSVVRNWGYFASVTRICREQFQPLDSEFKEAFGLKLTDVVSVFEHLIRRQERLVSEHWAQLKAIFARPSISAIVDAFFERFPFRGEQEEWANNVKRDAGTVERLKNAIWPLADIPLTQTFFFYTRDVAADMSLDFPAVEGLFERISMSLGDLADRDPQSFVLENPVWLKPLIKLTSGEYFCALPQTPMSFIYSVVDNLLADKERLRARLADVRGTYLEKEVERLLRSAFPDAQVATNVTWKGAGKNYETDLVLRYDSTLLLVEAKSGKVSWPALRGAPDRLMEHVRRLIVDPSEQSGRLAMELQSEVARLKTGAPPALAFPIPLEGVTAVQRVSVILHDFATVQCIPSLLRHAGVLKNVYPLAPCFSLADLEVMTDLLDAPWVRLHYLRQRASSLMTQEVLGDELDILGLYLDTSLDFGGLKPGEQRLVLSGYSKRVDRYYTARDENQHSRKPARATTPWFNRLCRQLFERSFSGRTEIVLALLSINPDEQANFERKVQNLARRLREGKQLRDGLDCVARIGPEWTNSALLFRVRRRDAPGRHGQGADVAASEVFEAADHVERCFVLVIDALSPDLPYLAGAMLTRADRDVPVTIYF